MNNQVWKFSTKEALEGRNGNIVSIIMPRDAKIIYIAEQNNDICIWAVVNPEAEKVERSFEIIGTGHLFECDESLTYIGSAQVHDGSFVFHIFEKWADAYKIKIN